MKGRDRALNQSVIFTRVVILSIHLGRRGDQRTQLNYTSINRIPSSPFIKLLVSSHTQFSEREFSCWIHITSWDNYALLMEVGSVTSPACRSHYNTALTIVEMASTSNLP
jgi:hypothetical protein